MKACKLRFPSSSSPSPSSTVSSLLFEPSSKSLALMHSDTSVLLFSSIPIPSVSPLPPMTPIPPISTSCCFLRLITDKSPHRVLFLSVCPQGASVLLRAWVRCDDSFVPAKLRFRKESGEHGVAIGLQHGFTVNIVGSVNFFVLHCPADAKILVLSARMGEGDYVEMMKCAVIGCVLPVYTVKVSPAFLMLGEVGGVRIFPLKPLVKGRIGKRKDLVGQKFIGRKERFMSNVQMKMKKTLPNGVMVEGIGRECFRIDNSSNCDGSTSVNNCKEENNVKQRSVVVSSDVNGVKTLDENLASTTKLRTVKLRQNSGDLSSVFVYFEASEVRNLKCRNGLVTSRKAVAVHALSLKKFIILDSVGDIHLLSVQYAVLNSEVGTHIRLPSLNTLIKRLDCSVKVQMLAVFPDASLRTQNIWISDACYSLYMASLADMETDVDEKKPDECRDETQLLATQAVFTSEKIHDIVALASNAVLVLGQAFLTCYYKVYFSLVKEHVCICWCLISILILVHVLSSSRDHKEVIPTYGAPSMQNREWSLLCLQFVAAFLCVRQDLLNCLWSHELLPYSSLKIPCVYDFDVNHQVLEGMHSRCRNLHRICKLRFEPVTLLCTLLLEQLHAVTSQIAFENLNRLKQCVIPQLEDLPVKRLIFDGNH